MLTTAITVARVKRIIHVDEEVNSCSNNAAFVITVAAVLLRSVERLAREADEGP